MFRRTRLKLTAWYLLIIMMVSLLFSGAIYRGMSFEMERSLRAQQFRFERERGGGFPFLPLSLDRQLLAEAQEHIKLNLLFINFVILTVSGVAGYFLAGRTLQPIEVMIAEQNRFISDASHELRTPITAMMTSIEVGLRDEKLGLVKARKLLSGSLTDVLALRSLSDDLIRLAVYQQSNGNVKFGAVNLSGIVSEAVKKVGVMAQQKKIAINNKVRKNIVLGDTKSLTELVVILLDNAIKYSPVGKKIFLESKKNTGRVILTVIDQGYGISKEDLPHIFDRFYRADKSRSKETGGYGLGLSIAAKIVKLHHGSIKAESISGKGTTFIVELPVKV